MSNALPHERKCLCGAVRFEIHGPLGEVIYGHCEPCQCTCGHFVAASAWASEALDVARREGLAWFASSAQSSERAQRGFCRHGGSSLFWRHKARDAISVMAGALDRPKTRTASHHMRAEQAGDCSLSDGMPQRCSERQVHGESG